MDDLQDVEDEHYHCADQQKVDGALGDVEDKTNKPEGHQNYGGKS